MLQDFKRSSCTSNTQYETGHTSTNNMGVAIEIITPGDGKTFPKSGDQLTMHYHGTLASNGQKFDASRDRGRPFKFTIGVGQVIRVRRFPVR